MTRRHFFIQSLLTLFNYSLFFGFPFACALRIYLQLTAGGGFLPRGNLGIPGGGGGRELEELLIPFK